MMARALKCNGRRERLRMKALTSKSHKSASVRCSCGCEYFHGNSIDIPWIVNSYIPWLFHGNSMVVATTSLPL